MLEAELKNVFGLDAKFRDHYQRLAVEKLINKERIVVVQKTGWGKSLVYFLATKILRKKGDGVTVIISPLLSLTRNQIESVKKYGLNAESINSQENRSYEERIAVIERCNNGECDVLFITPEQLQKEEFMNLLSGLKVGLFVVDEAHCISDWGHDFRPDYRRIRNLLQILPKNIGILATTATANDRVIEDIAIQLGNCEIIRGPLIRKSIHLHKIHLPTAERKYAWLAKNVKTLPGTGIIYATTIKECERIARWLKANQIEAYAYHSNLTKEEKIELETKLINNELKALVSTIALGMGFDKEDIQFIIHYYTPKSMIEYYQQIGRAGRNIDEAYCILLYGDMEEQKINQYFIYNSFPEEKDFLEVIHFLENVDNATYTDTELIKNINLKRSVLDQILKLLMLDGIIEKKDSKYSRLPKPYQSNESYYQSVIEMKVKEYEEMLAYQNETNCLMQFITTCLDDPYSEPCNQCSNCLQSWTATDDIINEIELNDVRQFLNNHFIYIEPRKISLLTNKKLAFQHEVGLALAYYHEELGQEASRGKYKDGRFSENLVQQSANKITRFLHMNNVVMDNLVIVPIPSNRHPRLVPDFAKSLAALLNVPFADVFAKKSDDPEQKSLLNSVQQEKNIRDYLYIKDTSIDLANQHILLVDDFVDSKWTFTIASELLGTKYENVKVTPFAIADTSGAD